MSAAKALASLPDIDDLRRLCQSLAALDAILCPEWEYRYFSFNASWGDGEMLASMRNGEGDDWLILFNSQGALIKGFVHDSKMAEGCPWPGVLDSVPREFNDFLAEPSSASEQTTFCLWRLKSDDRWHAGEIGYPDAPDPDGALALLSFLDGDPETYQQWGEEYFGARLNPRAVEHVYRHDRLTSFIVRALNLDVKLEDVRAEVEEIGYPL